MGFFDKLANAVKSEVKGGVNNAATNAATGAIHSAASNISKGSNKSETFTFSAVPTSVAELQALPEASLDSPFKTTALVLLTLLNYDKDVETTHEMLNFLKGPDNLSPTEKSFIKERLTGKKYVPYSYFAGATVQNGYTPTVPYTITVHDNPYSYPDENWATIFVTSSGADSDRQIKLRKKPSTGQWFLNEIQCLSDIRVPASEDPWA